MDLISISKRRSSRTRVQTREQIISTERALAMSSTLLELLLLEEATMARMWRRREERKKWRMEQRRWRSFRLMRIISTPSSASSTLECQRRSSWCIWFRWNTYPFNIALPLAAVLFLNSTGRQTGTLPHDFITWWQANLPPTKRVFSHVCFRVISFCLLHCYKSVICINRNGRENYVVTSIIRLKQWTAGNSRFPATSFLRPSSSDDVVASCSTALPGLQFLFYTMDSCRTRYRTTSIKDVMEPVRYPTSGFDPEPSTIAEVGTF